MIANVWAVLYAYAFNAIGKVQNWIAGAIVFGIVVDAVVNFNVAIYALPVALYLAQTHSPKVHSGRSGIQETAKAIDL